VLCFHNTLPADFLIGFLQSQNALIIVLVITMGNIYMLPASKGLAEFDGKGLHIALHYDENAKPLTERMRADPKFGIDFYNILLANGRAIAIDSANRIGADTGNPVEANFEYEQDGPDTIEIFDDSRMISRTNGFVSLMWEAEAAINLYQICHVHFDPENIIPADTEGWFEKSGQYKHLNRETFVFVPGELKDKKFGDGLSTPVVYKSERTINGFVPELQTSEPSDAPYIFMPDDQLSRMLFGIGEWEGNWLEHFRDFHTSIVREK